MDYKQSLSKNKFDRIVQQVFRPCLENVGLLYLNLNLKKLLNNILNNFVFVC